MRPLSYAVLAVLTLLAADARADERRLVVRVYETDGSDAAARETAIRVAEAIVADAGITIEWQDCTANADKPSCRNARARDLIVRIMPDANPAAVIGKSTIQSRANTSGTELPLGFAVIDPLKHTGRMATLFQAPVRAVANRNGADAGELLGRALAHEVGHLLLRVSGHSESGLMRAIWTDAEMVQNRPDDWSFAPADRHRLKLAVAN